MINIQNLQILALDTNIFICALNIKDPRQEEIRQLLEEIKRRDIEVFISVLVLEEFFIRVYKQGREKDTSSILDFITLGNMSTVVDVNSKIALLAANLRAKYPSLRSPDAIHLASAIISGADIFITTDRKIPRAVEGLKVIVIA